MAARAAALLAAAAAVRGKVAVPSPQQLDWMDMELGAMVTWNLQTICSPSAAPGMSTQRCQKGGARGPLFVPTPAAAAEWDPHALDTDEWARVAASFGARYIVLVADHMTGFTLWDTAAHNFSIAHTRWRGGGGDVVRDLIASCKRFGLRLGVFYSVHFNWYFGVDGYRTGQPALGPRSLTRDEFISVAKQQLQELAGLFGPEGPAEVWFDGGAGPFAAEIGPWVRKVAPGAVCHSCLPNFTAGGALRWMGNEEGVMPLPSWGAADGINLGQDGPLGQYFIPPSTDTVLREHYWFWENNTDGATKTVKQLVHNYLTSVGRASNLILNMAPDSTGAVPRSDVAQYAAMGAAIRCLFGQQLARTAGALSLAGGAAEWVLPAPVSSANVSLVIEEDLTQGQLIGNYSFQCAPPSGAALQWAPCTLGSMSGVIPACAGGVCTGVGHKRILMLLQEGGDLLGAVRVQLHSHFADPGQAPALRSMALYDWDGAVFDCA
eukprot:TRINITY_DN1754_c0_g1_i4.p1 TRINITY_DN1754_c0_g1~~TRINITY_DN1754_c0_g1_i4.p1  ORF type:complete len:492 (+),score=146.75 TRINITY_DN1754_c0_g1_i4:81-1556(+)